MLNRRQFVLTTGAAAGVGTGRAAAASSRGVSIIASATDPVAAAEPVRQAVAALERELAARQVPVRRHADVAAAPAADLRIMVSGAKEPGAREILTGAGISVPGGPEALALAPGKSGGKAILLAAANDARGLSYALLELADRARFASNPLAALEVRKAIAEKPANTIRSMARCFESDLEDKSWFHDRSMWSQYLAMLAAQRLNRFSLTLGLGYNFPRNVTDVYMYFAYPFLLPVPGHNVRATGLSDAERDRNLETLRFIGEETVKHGLDFQLGLWTHAYEWIESPNANHRITGLTAENHAAYSRDAVLALLKACPTISGVTFRVHGESGVPEGNYSFWETLFDGVARCGRKVEIDMHAKGMDQKMIDVALASGMPVVISPKYWAEHMGLAYHQAGIRGLEMPPKEEVKGVFALSAGSRRFLRYGYGDLLAENRRYGVLYRIWPGTQRVLLWGDPALAAGYGRLSSFCGSQGVEWCEPLSFKGRMGSGVAGGRCGYADSSLNPKYDWEKFLYTYRVWGRLLYNPEADSDTWRRYLNAQFQTAARQAETALASASRVLPLITTAHGLSGSNNQYWPEIYTNMPIVDESRAHPYRDTPKPARFGTVSSFDPQLFSTVDEFAAELVSGEGSGKHSPVEVAQWLEDLAAAAVLRPDQAPGAVRGSPEFRRLGADVSIQRGVARFFALKFRAAVLWGIHDRTGDPAAGQRAVETYRAARNAWAEMAEAARGVYSSDITYGRVPNMRGHWLDRLPAIDADLADMEKRLQQPVSAKAASVDRERIAQAVRETLARPARPAFGCRHEPAPRFEPSQPLEIGLSLKEGAARRVRLHYRHVNQAETWRSQEMTWRDRAYRAALPPEYTQSPYALQYYFELHAPPGGVSLYPGFEPNLSNQPYFVIRSVS